MVEMAATASNYKMEVVNANKTSTNNYKMEVVAAQEKKGDKKDKKERISEEKEIKEEEKPNATIHEEKPLPRLPCSGSSWCNILCGAGAGSHTCKKRVIAVIYHRNFFWIFRKILG